MSFPQSPEIGYEHTVDGKVWIYMGNGIWDRKEINISSAQKVEITQISDVVLDKYSWIAESGLWVYNVNRSEVEVNSMVEIIPANVNVNDVRNAQILPEATITNGQVKLYAENQPANHITITLNIITPAS